MEVLGSPTTLRAICSLTKPSAQVENVLESLNLKEKHQFVQSVLYEQFILNRMKKTLQGLKFCMQDDQDEESLANRWETMRSLRVQATHSLSEGGAGAQCAGVP